MAMPCTKPTAHVLCDNRAQIFCRRGSIFQYSVHRDVTFCLFPIGLYQTPVPANYFDHTPDAHEGYRGGAACRGDRS